MLNDAETTHMEKRFIGWYEASRPSDQRSREDADTLRPVFQAGFLNAWFGKDYILKELNND